ncbi:twin-arginine translocase subunit TatC [Bacillus alkalicellulosilyticus]|uniref:twin-arginine translocase subunit TatC n=1 Tax=Alkalihalobacterium alkalicellulosilyticum TaxID=1912214 RepID=UPI000998E039|nr:twin-arginine translocase subunit TatC [Bacillus alkalicellulosilyticus]
MDTTSSMPIIDHLEELRKRIIVTGLAFFTFFILSFVYVKDIYQFLIRDVDYKLTILSPVDVIWAYMMISAVVALTLTVPLIAYQLWKYISPGMKPAEKSASLFYIPVFLLLFILGLCFGFYIIFPIVMNFLLTMVDGQFETMFTVDRYFKFMFSLTVPLALLFELPAVVLFLTKIGLITPNLLVRTRKYAYFLLIVISVLITPPDFLSDVLVIIPLLLLYEVSITLSRIIYRKMN